MTKAAIVQKHLAELLDEELSSVGFQGRTKWAVRRETLFVDQDIEFQPLSAWDAFVINLRSTFKWSQLLQEVGSDKFNRNTVASIRISRLIDPMQELRIPATERSYKKVHRDVALMIKEHGLPYFDRFRQPEEFVKAVESGEFSRTELSEQATAASSRSRCATGTLAMRRRQGSV